ncbi:MAG: efflux transporter outer membrane subunit [Burkholderiales bacterium]|nr:efflux transporter outer membrane subunit [Burkholderiales bacterium]
MSSVKQQQECPRRAGATPQTGEPARASRVSRQPQHRGLELDMPRVLSAGTVALAVASAAVLMLAGCADMGHQSAPVAIRGADTMGLANAVQTTPVQAQWWHQFGDARLDDLVAQALAGSPNLGAAQARVARAQAVVDSARGAELPHVDFDASVKRELLSRNGLFPPPYGGSVLNQANASFGLKWDADLFGRQKADLEAALGSARAAQADADVAAQQIATQVVRTYFALARLESQRAVAQRTYDQRSQMLTLIKQRVGAGLDTVVEQKQGEGALPDTLAQIESLDEQIDLTRHMLAALTAQPMEALATLAPTLDTLHVSPQPPVLGADLIARRPDVAAALARVEASEQQVKSQRAQFYPDINFSAGFGLDSIKLSKFLELPSKSWSFGPALHLPIFEGGQLRAQLKGKGADRDAAIQAYNQQVIDAVREAADAATSAASIGRQLALQRQALEASTASYDFSQKRYGQGLGNALVVLNAETQMLAERRLEVDLEYRALDVQAQLMKALGGGWTANVASTPPAAAASQPMTTTARNDNLSPA